MARPLLCHRRRAGCIHISREHIAQHRITGIATPKSFNLNSIHFPSSNSFNTANHIKVHLANKANFTSSPTIFRPRSHPEFWPSTPILYQIPVQARSCSAPPKEQPPAAKLFTSFPFSPRTETTFSRTHRFQPALAVIHASHCSYPSTKAELLRSLKVISAMTAHVSFVWFSLLLRTNFIIFPASGEHILYIF